MRRVLACIALSGCLFPDLGGLTDAGSTTFDASGDAATDAVSTSDAPADAIVSDVSNDVATDGSVNAYTTAVLTDGPIAYYKLEEPSGSTITSTVTGAPSGSFTKGVTLGTARPITASPSNLAASFFEPTTGTDSDLGFANASAFTFLGNAPFT